MRGDGCALRRCRGARRGPPRARAVRQPRLDGETARALGNLPGGRGILDALIADPRALRLHDVGRDARFPGFPAGHAFLGVPILVFSLARPLVEARSVLVLLKDGDDLVVAADNASVAYDRSVRLPIAGSTSGRCSGPVSHGGSSGSRSRCSTDAECGRQPMGTWPRRTRISGSPTQRGSRITS